MQLNLKKMWPTAAASLVAFTSLLNADDAQMQSLETRVTALEQRKGANGVINPAANPRTNDGVGLFFTGEALYWKAHENGLEYAIEAEDGSTGFPVEGEFRHPKTRYDWGFRLGVGYTLPHDGWDLNLTWTRFRSKARHCDDDCDDCCSQCGTETFFPTMYAPCETISTCPNVTDACGKWQMRMDLLDLELGREFYVSKWLTLRPHMGFRGAWIRQKNNVEYAGGTYVPAGSEFEIENKNRYRGGGLRGGLNTNWYFVRDWALYGNLAISILYGQFTVSGEEENEVEATGAETTRYDVTNKFIMCRPITDLAFGIKWDHGFDDGKWFLGFNFGWEQHYFFGQNQFFRFVSPATSGSFVSNQGDLGVAGWVLGARLDF
jgi:hypothetical protein